MIQSMHNQLILLFLKVRLTVTSGQNTVTVNLNNTDFEKAITLSMEKDILLLFGVYKVLFIAQAVQRLSLPKHTLTMKQTME